MNLLDFDSPPVQPMVINQPQSINLLEDLMGFGTTNTTV
jgi:hypothetical protein